MNTYTFWVSSPANATFSYEEEFTVEELGYTDQEWDDLSEEEKDAELESYCKTILFDKYIEYGCNEEEGN